MRLRISEMKDNYAAYGHGKLLITGEYFVLDGAKALALPTRLGQSLRVQELHSSEGILYWVALNSKKQSWLSLVFDTSDFSCINSQQAEALRLSGILKEAKRLNPQFLADKKDLAVETRLEFPNEWGLGSSSSLIHCVSKWANVDGFTLLQNTIGGSGYDVACATHDSALLYQLKAGKPETVAIKWQPEFFRQLYFVYTGKKQLSGEGIKHYRQLTIDKQHLCNEISATTEAVLECKTLDHFEELLDEHERVVGAALKMIKVKDTLFADYWGSVKSLGAWGGDFVLMTNAKSEEDLKEYLSQRDINTCFRWDEIILPKTEEDERN